MLSFELTRKKQVCWICGKDLSLDYCKTDERGIMVHQGCDARRALLNAATRQIELWRTSRLKKSA